MPALKSTTVKKPTFITGIGTGVGKTVASAIFVEKFKADYWKPVQSGDLDNTDTDQVRSLVSNTVTKFHPEAYRLTQAFSPHRSAALDGIIIVLDKIVLPETSNQLIIEGAGGLMAPLNDKDLMIDLIKKFDAEVILVSQNYLGSINHTLMSAEILRINNISISKFVICGKHDKSSEDIIFKHLKKDIIHIPMFDRLDKDMISEFAGRLT